MGGMNPHKKGTVVGKLGSGGMHNPADHGIQQEIPEIVEEPIEKDEDVGHSENLPKTD